MQCRNIFITSIRDKTVSVAFLDMNDNYTTNRIADNFELVYLYISNLFPNKKLQFYICGTDNISCNRLTKQLSKADKRLQNKHIFGCFAYKVLNLDVRKLAFNNVKILL